MKAKFSIEEQLLKYCIQFCPSKEVFKKRAYYREAKKRCL